jgi:hypothetical protein
MAEKLFISLNDYHRAREAWSRFNGIEGTSRESYDGWHKLLKLTLAQLGNCWVLDPFVDSNKAGWMLDRNTVELIKIYSSPYAHTLLKMKEARDEA